MSISIAENFNSNKRRVFVAFSIFSLAVGLDQLTKIWARQELKNGPKFIGSTQIGFSLTSNSGSAFSFFQNSTIILTVIATFIVIALLVAAFRSESRVIGYCYVTIAGGATGNLVDRFLEPPYGGHGHVTDFIKIGSFPIFNVADSFVTVGAVFLVVMSLFVSKEKRES